MFLTFPDRRCQTNQQMPIAEVKAAYPSLFDFTQVKRVFVIMRWFIFSSLFQASVTSCIVKLQDHQFNLEIPNNFN